MKRFIRDRQHRLVRKSSKASARRFPHRALISSLLVTVCLGVIACASNKPPHRIPLATSAPVIATSTVISEVLTPKNVERLKEVQHLAVDDAGPVAALAFSPDQQTLLVAHSGEGVLRRWMLADADLLATLNLAPFGLGGTSFDADGTLFATSAGAEWETHRFDEAYKDYSVWNTQTGEAVIASSEGSEVLYPEIQISPDGYWFFRIGVDEDGILQHDKPIWSSGVQRGGMLTTLHLGIDPAPEEFDYDVLVFDMQGDYFAAANEAGKVAVYRFDKANPHGPPGEVDYAFVVIEPSNLNTLGPVPLALGFDPTRHWLARVRGKELVVWDLQSDDYQRHMEGSVGDVIGISASLAFNPTGDLLGVGTANGWQIWNVETGELLASVSDVEVYAVMFSPDGRLFVWGDSLGIVHIWGVP
jgi:WD40 repeat protein